MRNSSITEIIDKHLQRWVDKGLNMIPGPGEIEPEMAGIAGPDKDGWKKWFSIESTITDVDIEEIEKLLGYRLPESYTTFLKHKYFYELYISEARFSGHVIRRWKRSLTDMVFNGYPREFLIDKGYIPFAEWNDWGMLCFDTNRENTDFEYPIIMWDHERWEEFELFSNNFYELLLKLDEEASKDGS